MRTTITEIGGVLHKRCPQCTRMLPLTPDYWRRNAKRKAGFAGWCKDCHSIVSNKTRAARDQRYYEKTQAERPGLWNERTRAWRDANRARFNANARKYGARRYAENAEAEREKRRQQRAANPESHRLHARNSAARRKARKRNAGYSDATVAHVRALLAKASTCPLCGVKLIKAAKQPHSREVDHIVPLVAGGTHTVGNLRVICRRCNLTRPRDGSDITGQVELWGWRGDASGTSVSGSRGP